MIKFNKLVNKSYFTLIILFFFQCHKASEFLDSSWKQISKSQGWGHYHKNNFSDNLIKFGVCHETIYGKVDVDNCNFIFAGLLLIADTVNYTDIQIKNSSSYSRLTFTFKDQVVVLAASEISKIITVPFDPVGLYKIETSSGVVFENSSFNFRGSLKDGTIITTDGTLINDLDLAGCNLINVETGEVETVSGQCLTPTNP